MSEALTNWIGVRIAGRYLIKSELAKGAMGRVFEAEQQPLGRLVAVKILDPSARLRAAADPERRFEREAATLARLHHPHTVRIIDFGSWRGQAYLVMELVRGRTLRELFADEGRLEPQRVLRLARQIAGSLAEAHSLGIVHRDLKPGNVLISVDETGQERAKVVDFGLVKESKPGEDSIPSSVVLGTPRYMSPEQITGAPVDSRSDVYALGLLMFRGLAGRVAFDQRPTAALLHAQVHAPAPALSELDLTDPPPPEVEALVHRCLHKQPARRFADGAALQREIDRILERARSSAPPASPSRWVAYVLVSIAFIATALALVVALSWLG